MARYNFWYINGGEGIIVKDYEKNKQLTPQEVIDLLNDHDGMITRKEVEALIWANFHFCNILKDGESEKRDAVERSLKAVLNGGTK